MNKELIDRVWKYYLPKEFKEEVKKMWQSADKEQQLPHDAFLRGEYSILVSLFGYHNLTSDAEGEDEMLCVSINALQHLYAENEERKLAPKLSKYRQIAECENNLLYNLFGSKCLPDELNEDNFAKSEPESDEPFKVGGKVKVYKIGNVYNGAIGEIIDISNYGSCYVLFPDNQAWFRFCDLEPYTEPNKEDSECLHAESVKESRIASEETHLRNLSQETADCDKEFDAILKDSFREHNRLHIAAMAMQGIMTNPSQQCVEMDVAAIANLSLLMADALLYETEKGGKSNERV